MKRLWQPLILLIRWHQVQRSQVTWPGTQLASSLLARSTSRWWAGGSTAREDKETSLRWRWGHTLGSTVYEPWGPEFIFFFVLEFYNSACTSFKIKQKKLNAHFKAITVTWNGRPNKDYHRVCVCKWANRLWLWGAYTRSHRNLTEHVDFNRKSRKNGRMYMPKTQKQFSC